MRRLFLFAIVLTLGAGVAFVLRSSAVRDPLLDVQNNRAVQTSAAFRDGLYLGGLAARHGEEPHFSEGRWANQVDRSSFKAGYQQEYDDAIAIRAAVVDRTH
jgi:hypothetical protein